MDTPTEIYIAETWERYEHASGAGYEHVQPSDRAYLSKEAAQDAFDKGSSAALKMNGFMGVHVEHRFRTVKVAG